MEYIKNLLKETIGVMFLCTVLYAITPRFIKVGIKTTFKILTKVTTLVIKLVKDICFVAFPSLKVIYDETLSQYKNDTFKRKGQADTKSACQDKVINFKKTAD